MHADHQFTYEIIIGALSLLNMYHSQAIALKIGSEVKPHKTEADVVLFCNSIIDHA